MKNNYETINELRNFTIYNKILANLYCFGFGYNQMLKKYTGKSMHSHLEKLEKINIIERCELTEEQKTQLLSQNGFNETNIKRIKAYKLKEKAKLILSQSRIGKFIMKSVFNKIQKKYEDFQQKYKIQKLKKDNEKFERQLYSKIKIKNICNVELLQILKKLCIDNCYKITRFTSLQLKNHVRKHYLEQEYIENWQGDNRFFSYKKNIYITIDDLFYQIQNKLKDISVFKSGWGWGLVPEVAHK